jgi:hypothetical protein
VRRWLFRGWLKAHRKAAGTFFDVTTPDAFDERIIARWSSGSSECHRGKSSLHQATDMGGSDSRWDAIARISACLTFFTDPRRLIVAISRLC